MSTHQKQKLLNENKEKINVPLHANLDQTSMCHLRLWNASAYSGCLRHASSVYQRW
jgi:hypothetical protein